MVLGGKMWASVYFKGIESPDPNNRVARVNNSPLRRLASLNVNGYELHWEENQGLTKINAARRVSHWDKYVVTTLQTVETCATF